MSIHPFLVAALVALWAPGLLAAEPPRVLPSEAADAISDALGRGDARYGGLRASNPRQGFRVDHRAGGPTIAAGADELSLRLVGIGRGDATSALDAVVPRAVANRVEYAHAGVTEWYANGPFGLEHGFRVTRRPPGRDGGPLVLVLERSGSLEPRLEGRALAFAAADGRTVLAARELTATDDRGRALPVSVALSASALRIEVDDRRAAYPVVVETAVESGRLTASDGAPDDFFGFSVAVAGDIVVVGAKEDDVGANEDQGSAYVFVRPAGGWGTGTQAAKLVASDGAAGDQFGISVAVSGNDVFVGSWNDDNSGLGGPGSVYVFTKPAGGWSGTLTQTARLEASDRQAGDLLGAAVAASGGVLVAGAPFDDDPLNAQGSVYVFVRPPGGWQNATEAAKLKASDAAATDRFGSAVAVEGNTIVIGAYLDDVGGAGDQGSVYVFESAGWLGPMTETAKLTNSDGLGGDAFGYSVAVDGGTVVSGAILHGTQGLARGAAYVFERPASGWATTSAFTARLVPAGTTTTDRVGEAVAIADDVIVIGARFASGANNSEQGAAFVYLKPAGGWITTPRYFAKLTAADGAASDNFGAAVARGGGVTVVGAWGHSFGGGPLQGQAYVFEP